MSAEERAANLLQARLSWPQAEGCAGDLARAGMLVSPSERRLIDAALEFDEMRGDSLEALITAALGLRSETTA